MNPPVESVPSPPAIDSRAGFEAALRWGFETAIAEGARRIVCCDRDFAQWPLDDPGLLDGFVAWLRRPQRQLVLLAATYDEVERRKPRFARWRVEWMHAIEAWQAPPTLAERLPTLLVSDGRVCVQLLDPVRWRGRAELDEATCRSWHEELDVALQQCERGFATRTLGL